MTTATTPGGPRAQQQLAMMNRPDSNTARKSGASSAFDGVERWASTCRHAKPKSSTLQSTRCICSKRTVDDELLLVLLVAVEVVVLDEVEDVEAVLVLVVVDDEVLVLAVLVFELAGP